MGTGRQGNRNNVLTERGCTALPIVTLVLAKSALPGGDDMNLGHELWLCGDLHADIADRPQWVGGLPFTPTE